MQTRQWQRMADGAWADYTKIAGKSKQAKPIIQQMGGLLKHVTGHIKGGQNSQQDSSGGGQNPGGVSSTPARQGQQTVAHRHKEPRQRHRKARSHRRRGRGV